MTDADKLYEAMRDLEQKNAAIRDLEADARRFSDVLALLNDRERVCRLMHESWCATKRAQGFHGPDVFCRLQTEMMPGLSICDHYHSDLVPWSSLPERQKDINRAAFDALRVEVDRIARGEATA